MVKLRKFFDRNYDYYILIFIISFSFLMSIFDYVDIFVIQAERTDFEDSIPCYIFDHYKLNDYATFEFPEFVIEQFSKPPRSKQRILIDKIAENILAFILIFSVYYLGKRIYYKTKKKFIKWGLVSVLVLYLLAILLFEIMIIWFCCCFHFG